MQNDEQCMPTGCPVVAITQLERPNGAWNGEKMVDFHETAMGQQFICGTMPSIARSLEVIAEKLEAKESHIMYGVTMIDSEGLILYQYDNKAEYRESETRLFLTKEAALEYAYGKYSDVFYGFAFKEEDGKAVDANGDPMMSKKAFCSEYPWSITIQGTDRHVSFEMFETTVENGGAA